jgi:Xaa-Pro dipeptidase
MPTMQPLNCADAAPIPESQFRDRAQRVREFVVSQQLGALIVFSTSRSHMFYQTGHVGYIANLSNRDRVSDSVVVIPESGEPMLLVAGLPFMVEQVREASWIEDVRVVGTPDPNAPALPGAANTFGDQIVAFMNERGLAGRKAALAGTDAMPLPLYRHIETTVGAQTLVTTEDVVADLRNRKSPAEIVRMRRAAQLSDLGYEVLMQTAKPGMRGFEVVAHMEHAMRVEGADYANFWLASGPTDDWTVRMAEFRPNERILQMGDQITCCSYAVYDGYWAHAMRTGTLGGPSPQQERMLPACLEVHRAGLEAMKPGVSFADVVAVVQQKAEAGGLTLHSPRIGHGIGLDYGERPYFVAGSPELLQPGMTMMLHTQLTIPGEAAFYVPLGDLCLVTDDGIEILTEFPLEPFRI